MKLKIFYNKENEHYALKLIHNSNQQEFINEISTAIKSESNSINSIETLNNYVDTGLTKLNINDNDKYEVLTALSETLVKN
ncbi:3871_t:CDS:2 [Gigaspora rosea]|nr:3871_t:CDS:2 [Gigaspora rosea]